MRIFPLRLLPEKTNYDFVKIKNIGFAVSIILILFSLILPFVKGINFGIDFLGGTIIELQAEPEITLDSLRPILNDNLNAEIILQNTDEDNEVLIKIGNSKKLDSSEIVSVTKQLLAGSFPNHKITYNKISNVGPQIGGEMIKNGIIAIILSFVGIMIYLSFRFEIYYGLGAILALLHDVIITVGAISLFNLEFNLTTIAALLTVVGYSVNDSVVIYDRIRENIRKNKSYDIAKIINLSINETLSRTILTVLTTLLAVIALIFFGGEVINSFAWSVCVGILVGTYSSIFISSPVIIKFLNKVEKKDA